METADFVWQHVGVATMCKGAQPYGAIEDGALATRNGRILWVGRTADMPKELIAPHTLHHEAQGCWITPALVDCHTHLIFAGNRAGEFEARLRGDSYESAARRGGGILSTVTATRAASIEELVAMASPRLDRLMADGVRLVEIKSGYGLSLDSELKMLRAARQLGRIKNIEVRTSFLGAHATPPEFAGRADAYVDHIINDMLPAIAEEGLADSVDAFAESIAFSNAQIGRIFNVARDLGFSLKLHADQLTDGNGAAFAADMGALSADHLEYANEHGARAMGKAGTVAVLLPGAYATVGAVRPPPVAWFREHGVAMAVATDCNPGSSPMCSLLMAANLACSLFRLTPEEAFAGITRDASRALGLSDRLGTLEVGKQANIALWRIGHPRELAYWMGGISPEAVYSESRQGFPQMSQIS
jgi:imidazolonepropionase